MSIPLPRLQLCPIQASSCRISAVLISRFILNLRETIFDDTEDETLQPAASLRFAPTSSRVLGSIGGPLAHGDDDQDDHDLVWDVPDEAADE